MLVHAHIHTYMQHHECTQAHTNLMKVDIQSCPCALHSQLPQSSQCVGEPNKPDIIMVDTQTRRWHGDGTQWPEKGCPQYANTAQPR